MFKSGNQSLTPWYNCKYNFRPGLFSSVMFSTSVCFKLYFSWTWFFCLVILVDLFLFYSDKWSEYSGKAEYSAGNYHILPEMYDYNVDVFYHYKVDGMR